MVGRGRPWMPNLRGYTPEGDGKTPPFPLGSRIKAKSREHARTLSSLPPFLLPVCTKNTEVRRQGLLPSKRKQVLAPPHVQETTVTSRQTSTHPSKQTTTYRPVLAREQHGSSSRQEAAAARLPCRQQKTSRHTNPSQPSAFRRNDRGSRRPAARKQPSKQPPINMALRASVPECSARARHSNPPLSTAMSKSSAVGQPTAGKWSAGLARAFSRRSTNLGGRRNSFQPRCSRSRHLVGVGGVV